MIDGQTHKAESLAHVRRTDTGGGESENNYIHNILHFLFGSIRSIFGSIRSIFGSILLGARHRTAYPVVEMWKTRRVELMQEAVPLLITYIICFNQTIVGCRIVFHPHHSSSVPPTFMELSKTFRASLASRLPPLYCSSFHSFGGVIVLGSQPVVTICPIGAGPCQLTK